MRSKSPPRDVPAERLYPDGVWFVDLAPLSAPALVPQRIATTLSIREQTGQPLLDTLRSALAGLVVSQTAGCTRC